MKRLFVFAITLTALLVVPLQAQDRRDERRDRHSDRDGMARISNVVRDCDQRAAEFRHALDRALDHSRLNGTRAEDRLNEEAKRIDHAVSRLRESWNHDRDVERSRQNVRDAIEAGRAINWALEKHAVRGHVQREWDGLRAELNLLAEVFHEPKIHWER
jgi:hypothetical protein